MFDKFSLTRISKALAIILLLSFWPIAFLLNNSFFDFYHYFLPNIFLALGFWLYHKKYQYWFLAFLPIIVFNQLFSLFLIIFFFVCFFILRPKKLILILLFFSCLTFISSFNSFYNSSIFVPNYQAQQQVLSLSNLYPSIFLARLFQNKIVYPWIQVKANLLALIDPNNYFFAFHPREIVIDNQNLPKYPFLALGFFLIGLYNLSQNKNLKTFLVLFIALLLNLTVIRNFDRYDLVLYLPVSLIIIFGFWSLSRKFLKWEVLIYIFFLVFSLSEFFRMIIYYSAKS